MIADPHVSLVQYEQAGICIKMLSDIDLSAFIAIEWRYDHSVVLQMTENTP